MVNESPCLVHTWNIVPSVHHTWKMLRSAAALEVRDLEPRPRGIRERPGCLEKCVCCEWEAWRGGSGCGRRSWDLREILRS